MSVLRRSFSGKYRRDGTAGVAELHENLSAVRQQSGQELVIIDDLPTQRIYEQKYFNRFTFHFHLMAKPGIREEAGNHWQVCDFSVPQTAAQEFR